MKDLKIFGIVTLIIILFFGTATIYTGKKFYDLANEIKVAELERINKQTVLLDNVSKGIAALFIDPIALLPPGVCPTGKSPEEAKAYRNQMDYFKSLEQGLYPTEDK